MDSDAVSQIVVNGGSKGIEENVVEELDPHPRTGYRGSLRELVDVVDTEKRDDPTRVNNKLCEEQMNASQGLKKKRWMVDFEEEAMAGG